MDGEASVELAEEPNELVNFEVPEEPVTDPVEDEIISNDGLRDNSQGARTTGRTWGVAWVLECGRTDSGLREGVKR